MNVALEPQARRLLESGTAGHELLMAHSRQPGNLLPGGSDALLASADVAFGQVDVPAAMACPKLRWVHITSAGYERYDRDDFRSALAARGAAFTTSSGVYAEPCAQHVLAMMLSLARRLPDALNNQRSARAWPGNILRPASRLLCGQKAVILGFGAIGRRLVDLLAPFNMSLTAIRRRPRGDEPCRTLAEGDVCAALADADHVISLLPGGEGTRHFVDRRRLAAMKSGAIFYNVGRGGTVDQPALLEALTSGRLAAACLDVTDPEPLPPDHPLWTAPNCYITPHSAGGHVDEPLRLVRHFLANLNRYMQGQPLLDKVM